MGADSNMHPSRRAELADFLRSRRAKISPSQVGLPTGRRRRVRGLRREEIAELADISVTWYTWLEQAREITVSRETIERLSSALKLEGRDREHLFLLTGNTPPLSPADPVLQPDDLIEKTLDSLNPNPAYLLNGRWDVLAWNRAAALVFGDFQQVAEAERNIVWLTFQRRSVFSRLFVDWDRYARCVLGNFRVDSSLHVGKPEWAELIQRLNQTSTVFSGWWPNHEIAAPEGYRKELLHPVAGLLTLEAIHLHVQESQELKIVLYLPSEGTDTRERLAALQQLPPMARPTNP